MTDIPKKRKPTPAQIAANRRNAKLSTGPRTKEGKERSSMNALKHGLRAERVLLPDEDPNEFREFVDELWRALDARDALQAVFAEIAIFSAWRLTRAARIEAGLLTHYQQVIDDEEELAGTAFDRNRIRSDLEMVRLTARLDAKHAGVEPPARGAESGASSKSESTRIGMAFLRAAQGADALLRLARYETTLVRRFVGAVKELQRLQAADGNGGARSTPADDDDDSS